VTSRAAKVGLHSVFAIRIGSPRCRFEVSYMSEPYESDS